MSDLASQLLKTLCTGLGEGNTNTEKLTNMILESDPQRDYNSTKIEIVQCLKELKASGRIQIITHGWELGQEFFYICAKRL
jgi:hypothetical protein